jgi:hypothetical protein
MATIDDATNINNGSTPVDHGRGSYLLSSEIDLAAIKAGAGGSGTAGVLAGGDIIQAIDIPGETVILNAGMYLKTAFDPNMYVDAWDCEDLSTVYPADGCEAPQVASTSVPYYIGVTADTLDVEVDAVTTAPSSGVIVVWALCVDVKSGGYEPNPGIAAIGS